MDILVLSDSHGAVAPMVRAVELTRPDLILHLGDCWRDGEQLHARFPDIPLEQVPGNCDFRPGEPAERLLVLEGAPSLVLRAFDASEDMLAIGIPALRILAVSYLISTLGLVLAAVFQALGLGTYSLALTMIRQVIFPLVLVVAVLPFQNLNLVWAAFVLAELLALPVGLLLWRRVNRQVITKIPQDGALAAEPEKSMA